MSRISLVTALVVTVLYLAAVQIYPEASCQNAIALQPIDYTASVSVFPLIMGANNILVPLLDLGFGFLSRKTLNE